MFKHVVFFILTLMHCIPDIPQNIQDQIERENFITQKAIWQTKQLSPLELTRVRASSSMFINNLNSFTDKKNLEDIVEKISNSKKDNLPENEKSLHFKT